jgi:hypothetical protein
MGEDRELKNPESLHRLTERRSGEDRRKGDSQGFFARGGIERRSGAEARKKAASRPRIGSAENAAVPSPAGEK